MDFGDDRLPRRFWRKVKVEESGCWTWTAGCSGGGYGYFKWGERKVRSHKLIYELSRGPVPFGLEIDHTCRNTRCVNPAHLEAVTHSENLRRRPDGWKVVRTAERKQDWTRKLSIAGYRRGQRTRDRVLLYVADLLNNNKTNEEIGLALGLRPRMVGLHLKKLRDSGTITAETSRGSFGGSWKNTRTIAVTKEGQDAVRESKVRLEGDHQPGPEAQVSHLGDDEDLLRRGGFDTGTWWDVGGD